MGNFDAPDPDFDYQLKGKPVEIRIQRALPLLVEEFSFSGQKTIKKITSGYFDPKKILKQNKITIFPEDQITVNPIFNSLKENFVGQKIIIKRSALVHITIDGKNLDFHTQSRTVKDLLREKNISLEEKDRVEPSLDTALSNEMTINIVRVSEHIVTLKETIAREIVYQNSPDLLEGATQVTQEGNDGEKEATYKVIYENGQESVRELLSEKTLSPSTPQIILQGVKPLDPGAFWNIIVDAANKYGIDPGKLYSVMMCESRGNPYAQSGFYGLFQYLPSTWERASTGAGFAGVSIYDPSAQIYVTAWKAANYGWSAWPVCGYR